MTTKELADLCHCSVKTLRQRARTLKEAWWSVYIFRYEYEMTYAEISKRMGWKTRERARQVSNLVRRQLKKET